ncbi:ImpB/MucB/SamB family protein, partial [Lacticaseibacillus rhamnosus MTCC 5462]
QNRSRGDVRTGKYERRFNFSHIANGQKMYGLKSNVSRQRDLPNEPHLIVVPPRMNLYIKKNLAINDIFRQFVA